MRGLDIISVSARESSGRAATIGLWLPTLLNAIPQAVDVAQGAVKLHEQAQQEENAAHDVARQHDVDLAAAQAARKLADLTETTAKLTNRAADIAAAQVAEDAARAAEVKAGMRAEGASPGDGGESWWSAHRLLIGVVAAGVGLLALAARHRAKLR